MTDVNVIEADELQKTFDGVQALRGLNLSVPAGSICGFLGRNGAGKTTTIKILLGMTRPTSGHARLFGLPADEPASSVAIRSRTGFVSEEKDLYGYMTVEDLIRFTAAFFPRWRSDLQHKYLRKFELPRDRKVNALSRGMRTKLATLLALSRGAELLILDEPTSGLDPAMAEELMQALVTHVANDGVTVLFSSHQIAEVEQIADRVTIIDRGQTVIAGVLDDLRESFCRIRLVFDHDAPQMTFRSAGVERIEKTGRVVTVLSSRGAASITEEARALNPRSVDVVPVTLKEIFLECTKVED